MCIRDSLNLLLSFVQVVHDLTILIATSGVQGAESIYGWCGQNQLMSILPEPPVWLGSMSDSEQLCGNHQLSISMQSRVRLCLFTHWDMPLVGYGRKMEGKHYLVLYQCILLRSPKHSRWDEGLMS